MRITETTHVHRLLFVAVAVLAAGCGGGGGGSTLPPAPTPTPAPTVTVSVSKASAQVGEAITLTWSSTNATSCTGADALSGSQAPSGASTITPTAGGQFKYTINCTSAGGSEAQSANLIVPHQVFRTSYENKNRFEITDTEMPNSYAMGVETLTAGFFHNRPFAIADFTQEGKFTVMAYQTQFSSPEQKAKGFADMPNRAYFLKRDDSGEYVDITASLIREPSDRLVCITPSYAVVADFNNDKKPDVFVACTGIDFQINGVWPDASTEQVAFISQADGTYKPWRSSFKAVAHQCSAGDLNGDSHVDVACVEPGKTPFVLLGDGKGEFVRDDERFPNLTNKAVGAIELVDLGGSGLDAFVGGVPLNADPVTSAQYNNVLIKNNGSGYFNVNAPIILPTSLSPKMQGQGKNYNYSAFHDVVVKSGYAYMLQYDYLYTSMAIRKVNLSSLSEHTVIFENLGTFTGGQQVVPLMKPTADGYLVPIMTCDFPRTDARFATSACAVKVKM